MLTNYTLGLYCYGIGLTAKLQDYFAPNEHFLLMFSHIGDPRYAFLVLYPFTYCLDNHFGLKVLWTSAVTEWLNAILKWIARDDRPYWWQSQQCNFTRKNLKQYPITCESGPGFPSGHVMSSSSLGLLLTIYLLKGFHTKTLKIVFFATVLPPYIAVLIMVSLSRMFIATHFVHQVVAGAIVGICVASSVHMIASKYSPEIMYHKKSILIGFVMLLIALFLYYLLMFLKLNPMSSVELALSFCKKKEWVHLDTTLFFAVIRDTGTLIGVGISTIVLNMLRAEKINFHSSGKKTLRQWIGGLFCGVLFCLLFAFVESFEIPQSTMFYFYAILKYILYAFSVIVVEYVFRMKYMNIDEKKKTL